MLGEGARTHGSGRLGRARRARTRLLATAVAVAAVAAVAASAAQAAEPPVITGVSPDHGELGFEGVEEHPPITITGEHLAGATVSAPDFWRESGEQEFQVEEDTETSLVVRSYFAEDPGLRELIVRTPGGTASTTVRYTPWETTLPTIGRCVRGSSEGGEYLEGKCERQVVVNEGETNPLGKFDWKTGLASSTVTFTGGAFGFRFYPRVTCTSVDGAGTLQGTAHEVRDIVLRFHGCEYQEAECSNTATAGDVETFPMLLSFGFWKKNWPKGQKKAAAGLFPEDIEGTIAQFQCGAESIAFGGGWEAPAPTGKSSTSLAFTFGQGLEGKEEERMIHEQWPFWSTEVVPLMKVDGEDMGMAGPYGTLSITAPEPFRLRR